MRTLVIPSCALLLLIAIGSAAGSSDPASPAQYQQTTDPSQNLGGAINELARATVSLFVAVNDAAYEVDSTTHNASLFLRAVAGLSKCVVGVFALVGIVAVSSLRRASRRFLS